MVDYYREVLSTHGIHVTVHRVPDEYVEKYLPKQYNPNKPRYILIARIGSGEKVLQFNGHYDVVPPGTGWHTDPFQPVIIGNRLYGRGASDMKGGIAAILATMIHLAQTGEPDIIVEAVLVPDEEIGGITGTGYLIRELGSIPDWVVIAEPSGIDKIYNGHRGNLWLMIKVHGRQAHGSSPWLGDNAFEKMITYAKLFIEKYREILETRISIFEYEDTNASKPSIAIGGLLQSAGAVNIVPGLCGFSVDRRLIIEENVESVLEEIQKLTSEISEKTGIKSEIEVISKSNPAYTPGESIIVEVLKDTIKSILNTEPKIIICNGGLDLKYYNEKKIPTVAYGPGIGEAAHKPDEYIELSHLNIAIRVYIELVKRLEQYDTN